jgi:hypothetical protein
MGSVTNKAIQNEAARRYVEEIWAERLREEGFICPDDKLLCWYRVVNKEIVHFICFTTNHSSIPVWLDVVWGAYPLFVQPYYIQNVCNTSTPLVFDMSGWTPIHEKGVSTKWFRDDIPAYVPTGGTCGLWLLDERILPWLSRSQTETSCYQTHMSNLLSHTDVIENGRYVGNISPDLVAYAIYKEDLSTYPDWLEKATHYIERLSQNCLNKPTNQQFRHSLQEWTDMLNVLQGGDREEFILQLEHRKQKTLNWLKKMGIPLE